MKYRVAAFYKPDKVVKTYAFENNYSALRFACLLAKNEKYEKVTVSLVEK